MPGCLRARVRVGALAAGALAVFIQPFLAGPGAAQSGDARAGRAYYASRCASCHSIGPSARAGFGPHLNAVIGRRAGGTADFAYSPGMKRSGLVWTEDNLRSFLRNPGKAVPGTSMRFMGVRGDRQMADLLAYLRQAE